jgi:hypothetical protein
MAIFANGIANEPHGTHPALRALVRPDSGTSMAKRLDYRDAGDARKMGIRGVEKIDGPGTAEEAKRKYRKVISKRDEDSNFLFRNASHESHERIAAQATADFEARQQMPSVIIRSPKLSERLAKRRARKARRNGKARTSLTWPRRGPVAGLGDENLALAKLVAGLLGLSSDDIFRAPRT